MNAGKEGSALAPSAAVLSDALQQAVLPLQPQSVQDFGNGAQSGAAVLAGTQNAVSYVLGLRTPLLRQGEVTVFFFRTLLVLFVKASVFCLRRVFIAYYRVSCYIFFSVSAGQHSKSRPCFVGTRGNVLPLLCCGLLYTLFAFALFFIGVATLFKNRLGLSLPSGLTHRVTWFNLSKIIYR